MHTPLLAFVSDSGEGTEAPSSARRPLPCRAGASSCVLAAHGRMLPGWASPAPTVPLISWPWQWQEQQTASPGGSAPSPDLAGPWASRSLGPSCPQPGTLSPGGGLCPWQRLAQVWLFLLELAEWLR